MAISRGLMFEINYSDAIRDSTARKNMIANAFQLMRVTKGKNIIISSNARDILELRGSFDVLNLYQFFNVDVHCLACHHHNQKMH